jgi:hypothetical protein
MKPMAKKPFSFSCPSGGGNFAGVCPIVECHYWSATAPHKSRCSALVCSQTTPTEIAHAYGLPLAEVEKGLVEDALRHKHIMAFDDVLTQARNSFDTVAHFCEVCSKPKIRGVCSNGKKCQDRRAFISHLKSKPLYSVEGFDIKPRDFYYLAACRTLCVAKLRTHFSSAPHVLTLTEFMGIDATDDTAYFALGDFNGPKLSP